MKQLEVELFLKELGDDQPGMSKPVMVIADDGEQYILKNQNVFDPRPQKWVTWDCMFLQETLVYNIATHLQVPIPECAAITVDKEFIDHAPTLNFKHRYSPGVYFGSKVLENVENNLLDGYQQLLNLGKPYVKTSWNNFFKKITNKDDIPKIIALDLLTANFDRFGNTGNILISRENTDRKMYIIDHGHAFSLPSWSIQKREFMMQASQNPAYIQHVLQTLHGASGNQPFSGLGKIFRALEQYIDISNPNQHCFQNIVHEIETISPPLINEWLTDIPEEWFVDKTNQIPLYTRFLMQQKDLIRILINHMAMLGAFDSHTGGDLSWISKRTGTL
ncbi:HipA family kinase [Bacillus paramycoides]|uniref:HipA family kinase n=1 Tax=Bacillus paramycoides TaxID=2026194 RepID=UPI003D027256